MGVERDEQVKAIFLEAFDLSASERERYLAAACGGDDVLRAEAEALLARCSATATSASTMPLPRGAGLAPGSVVAGRYRVEGELGAGGMGYVYRATQLALGREVALKVLASGPAASEAALERFEREAAAVARLRHPNVVTVYDAGAEPGVGAFFAMELVSGRSLGAELADRGRLGVAEAVDLMRQVSAAVDAAHRAGIIHRDLKPANTMLERSGAGVVAKVLDFGIAKLVGWTAETHAGGAKAREAGEPSMTASGAVFGTPLYMSPEQARGENVDERTDVWSLGLMLYELVAGTQPFARATVPEVFLAILRDEPAPLDSAAGAPAALARLVERALAKEPSARIATAGEFARELARIAAAAPPTPFDDGPLIGRDEELAALVAELRGGAARLVTLTGPGGTGKTRLARRAAHELFGEFEDGALFVDLSTIRDPALVVSAIAHESGAKESGGRPLDECLVEHLRAKHALLVLDNFEQVLGAAPLVARLLEAAPRLTALATSRASLHVPAERELAVPPLAVPPGDGTASVDELGRCAAVALFVERARGARRGFALTERNAAAVADVCRRLDGLPLAIELAAARVKMLSPEALLARLGERLKLLATSDPDVPERQRTLRGAIAWSFDLLDESEKRLFRRLAVFSGGWTLEMAEAVCADAPPDSLAAEGVLDCLTQLVEKSLVTAEERGDEARFRMLEAIREFAAERLHDGGERDRVRASHAGWFLGLAERTSSEILGAQAEAVDTGLEAEQDNLRAALEWSEEAGGRDGFTLRLCAALGPFWFVSGRWSEGRSWSERALAGGGDVPDDVRATALHWAGCLARWQSDYGCARHRAEECLSLRRRIGDRPGVAKALIELGHVHQFQRDLDGAEALLREAVALNRELGDNLGSANALSGLAVLAYDRSDEGAVVGYLEEALACYRRLGDRRRTAVSLYNLGAMAHNRGEYGRAKPLLEESLALAREFGERPLVARVTHYLGNVAGGEGEYARAAELRGKAALEYVALGDGMMIVGALEDAASEAAARGRPRRAARLLGAVRELQSAGALPQGTASDDALAEVMAAAKRSLGEAEFERVLSEVSGLTVEQAIRLVLDDSLD